MQNGINQFLNKQFIGKNALDSFVSNEAVKYIFYSKMQQIIETKIILQRKSGNDFLKNALHF